MSIGWVAATTRGRALLHRSIGAEGARAIATATTWPDARNRLVTTMYGAGSARDADRATARREAAAATTWQLRVLSGWLPLEGARLARLAVAPVEIANIEHHLARLAGSPAPKPIALGTLGTAWPRISSTTSPDQVRSMLARSAWGDSGGSARTAIRLGLRVAWARRVVDVAPDARLWGHGAIASLIARERFVFDRDVNDITGHAIDQLVGRRWRRATTVPDLADRLPGSASWALSGITTADDLWRSEIAIVQRVARDADRIAASGRHRSNTVAAIMALLLVDLWRVTSSIEAAGRGPVGVEVVDAVA